MIPCYLLCLNRQLWELRRYCALDKRESEYSCLPYLQKKKGADDTIYFVSLSVPVGAFFANLMLCFFYTSLLRIFLWSLGVRCMKGMIFKVGHSFNINKHHSVSVF